MIYQTLITARWKPHLLSWCMVMIASRHRLPWILTKALLSSPLLLPQRTDIFIYIISSLLLSYPPWLCFIFSLAPHSPFFCVPVFDSPFFFLHALSLHRSPSSISGYCFHFWAIPSMPRLILRDMEKSAISCSVSFHLSVLFWNEKPWRCLGQYWNGASALNITVTGLFSTWYGHPASVGTQIRQKKSRSVTLGGFTPAADHQISSI